MSFQTLQELTVRARVARVNLLPADFADARRARRLHLLLGAGVLVVAAACGGAGVISTHHVSSAQDALLVEQAKTAALQAAQEPYADVPVVLAELATAKQVQATVDAYDVAWYQYLDEIASKSPDGISLTNLALSVTTEPSETTGVDTNPLAVAGIGTLAVTGEAASQAMVAAWLDAMATIPGVTEPTLANSVRNAENGVVTFDATATLTDDILQTEQ